MSTFKDPYPYQERVGQYLLKGKSVILQAPTGSGKTAASLLPFLHARQRLSAEHFPRKCIYSVPMKVLANQFEAEYHKIITRYGWQKDLKITVQTGDRPDDTMMEGDLIFTTIDQTLSNFLNIPYGVPTKLANINAGAVLSSYLVFDELHLYDPDTTLPTVLEMLRMLKEITPFVVMTATFSSSMLNQLADLLGAVIVPENENARQEMTQIGSQVGKDRRFYAVDNRLTAEMVLAKPGKRVICICNTVKAAQNLYAELKSQLAQQGDSDTQLHLLHSRFYKKDRDTKEKWIREQFGIAQDSYVGPRLIQIATQVIEVGVDATCDVLHTELSPASSLLQRAGRCARRANETGVVYVYLPRDDEELPDYTPYFLKSQARKTERGRRLCEATWSALQLPQFTGQPMGFSQEQALIDVVHTPIDQEILAEMGQISHNRRENMLKAMRSQERGLAPELIRDVNSRFVFVHPAPQTDEKLAKSPWAYDGFSLFPGGIAKAFKQLLETGLDSDDVPWMMRTPTAVSNHENTSGRKRGEEIPDRLQQEVYVWNRVTEPGETYQTAVLAVHPHIVKYDTELGFRFELSDGSYRSPLCERKGEQKRYRYELETYAEHVAGLFAAYCQSKEGRLPLKEEIAFVVRRLETELPRFKLEKGALDTILRAMFACHDLGKLSVEWQKWAHEWQRRVGQFYQGADMSLPFDYMAAHTKYDPNDKAQWQAQGKMWKRPNHAGESAMAGASVFDKLCGESEALWRAAVTAVARHHNASTNGYQAYLSHKVAPTVFQAALQEVGLPLDLSDGVIWHPDGIEELSPLLVNFDGRSLEAVWLYFLLIRVLRLADQRSQSK